MSPAVCLIINGVNDRYKRNLVGVVVMGDIPQVGDRIEDRLSVHEADMAYQRHFQGPVRVLEVVTLYTVSYMLW
jgi:hypothetical protein